VNRRGFLGAILSAPVAAAAVVASTAPDHLRDATKWYLKPEDARRIRADMADPGHAYAQARAREMRRTYEVQLVKMLNMR